MAGPLSGARDRLRRRLRPLVALGVGAGLLLAGEVALRLALPARRTGFSSEAVFGRYDPTLGWTNRAGVAGRYEDPFNPRLTYGLTLDAAGLRGVRARTRSKPEGVQRVVVLGDSLTFGHGVEDAETFCALLEQPDREVLNFGVCGYGVGQMLLRLRQEALSWQPDLVVLAVIPDDLRRATQGWASNGFPRPRFRLAGEALREPTPGLPAPRESGQALPREDASLLLAGVLRVGRTLRAGLSGIPAETLGEPWRLGAGLIRAAHQACQEAGVGFAVAVLPEPGEVEGEPSPLRELLLGLDDGFPVWDLLPEFLQAGGRVLLIPGDGHPNAQGQRVLADLLRPRLDALSSSASRAPGLGSR